MSKEKQILQCCASGFSQRRTAGTLGVSRNTVSAVIAAAKRQHISAQAAELMDEPDLILKLFPEKAFEPTQETPDFDKIHKELLRSGVTLRILWDEYRGECLAAKKTAVHVLSVLQAVQRLRRSASSYDAPPT